PRTPPRSLLHHYCVQSRFQLATKIETLSMHDLKFLRTNRDKVEAGVALKGMHVDLARFYAIEERRLKLLHETEQLKARRNAASEEIAARKKRGEDAGAEITAMREVADHIKALDLEL